MNNANKPAAPVSVAVGPAGDFLTSDDYGVGMGLTKREYFAGQAIAGLSVDSDLRYEQVAEYAVNIADVVLKRLEETNDAN